MSEEQSTRKARGKQPKSYRLEDLYSFLEEDSSAPSSIQTPVDDSEDFVPDAGEEEPDDDFDEDVVKDEEEEQEQEGEERDDEHEGEFSQPPEYSAPNVRIVEVAERKRKKPASAGESSNAFARGKVSSDKVRNVETDKPRTRGVAGFSKIGGQEIRLRDLFGPDSEDLKPILATRDYWSTQETLPLRQTGGLRRSFFEKEGGREKEAKVFRAWYADTGKDAFTKGQVSRKLSVEETRPYINNDGPDSLNVLSGPIKDLQLSSLKKGSYINAAESFKENQDRRGWLFYLGSRIQDAQWAANEHGSTQYLAAAVEKNVPGFNPKLMESPKAPAFTATKAYPASIQVWAFKGTKNGALDMSKEPRLELVICTDWGAPKQLRWCPVKPTDGLDDDSKDHESVHVGLLAGIWSDGKVRVLDVSIPKTEISATEPLYLHYSCAAFDITIPQTIPTCLHWLSAASLAVATAAGTVAMWTLTRPDTFPSVESGLRIPKPWFYKQLADTYIITISSGWPSQPQYLSVSIADGCSRLYDIRTPNADRASSIRGRALCMTQAWHEHTQSFVMPDEHYVIKHSPIRRYYHNLYSMRCESSIIRVATSPVHPGVLIGTVDGTIEACNPVGRITNYKVIPWQQKWFDHEWRGPVKNLEPKHPPTRNDEAPGAFSSTSREVSDPILSQPLVRITEGHKATQPGIQHSIMSKKPSNPEIGKGITVFEENSSITAVAWNPNLGFGTWAVAGMGSGLLRVEDIGV